MYMLMLTCVYLRTIIVLDGIPASESSNFPLEDCFSQEMDILMLFYYNGDVSDNIYQYTTSQHLFQHLLSSPYNKTTSRVLYTYVFDTFSETNPNIDISSWYFHTSIETLQNRSLETEELLHLPYTRVNKTSFETLTNIFHETDVTYTPVNNLVPKIKFVRRFFSEMSGVREYATHIAVIFLDGTSLSYDEGRKIPSIIQQQNTDIKIFVVVHGGQYDQERKYFSDTIFLEKYDHVTTNYILVMAICKQCMHGWFPFEHNGSSDYLSCYQLLDSNLQISWYEAMSTCNVQFGGHLAAIETQQELVFLRRTLPSYLKDLKSPQLYRLNSSEMVAQVYIGLKRDKTSVAQRFQWSLNYPTIYRPLVLHSWLEGKPSGGYERDCAVFQFDWLNRINDTNFSINENRVVEGWVDVRCRAKLSRLSLCEVDIRLITDDTRLRLDPASRNSFNTALTKGDFVIRAGNIVSISANAANSTFLRSLQETETHAFPLFNCEEETGDARYISYMYVCDNINHCENKRDEKTCYLPETHRFICQVGHRLVSDLASCDDVSTCDGEDMIKCEHQCTGIFCCDGSCLPLQWVNDGEIDCSICEHGTDMNDESEILNKYLKKNITCALICEKNNCVHFSQLNDGNNDCGGSDGPIDETIGKLESANSCYNILGHIVWAPRCVYVQDMYGAVIGCRDMSHLKECTDFLCPEGYFKCPDTYCIPQHYVLNGKADCPTGEEEDNENIDLCLGNFACWNSTVCLHPDLVCDGHPECPHQDDEVDCGTSCAQGLHCVSGTVTVSDYNKSIPITNYNFFTDRTRYVDTSGIDMTKIYSFSKEMVQNLIFINWSNCNIQKLPAIQLWEENYIATFDMSLIVLLHLKKADACPRLFGNVRYFNISYNNKLSVQYLSLPFLEVLDLSHTAQSYIDYDYLIGMPMLRHLNLSFTLISSVHRQSFSSQYNLQTLDLCGIPFDNFNEDLFNGLTISQHMYTDKFEMCCPHIRGDNIPDYTCHAPEDPFSSCYDLLKDNVQRALLLVIAVVAVLGNANLFICRVIWDRAVLKTGYGLFLTNLYISDFIMGMYICIIVGADYKYRDVYVPYDKTWRESIVCKLAGFLVTLSSETSIYFIFLLTLDRFFIIKFPHIEIKFSCPSQAIAVSLSWIAGSLLALIPIVLKFEINSSNALCLDLPFSTQRLKGQGYSFCVFTVHNLCIVLVIILCQRTIIRSISQNTALASPNLSCQENLTVNKQLSLLVMSNVICWLSVGIMGLLPLGEHEISNEVYAWTTVIILPIHSAANPILYTISVTMAKWNKFKHGR